MTTTVYIDDKATTPSEITLEVEELEEVIAPGMLNHNETFVEDDEVELSVEELEETLTPTPSIPLPPPLRNH